MLALAQRCWNAALERAGEQAQRDLSATRAALADEAAQLAAGHELHAQGRQELQLAQAQTAAAQTSIDLLRTQLAETTTHAHELRTQRDGAYARAERLEQQLAELRNERHLLQQTHQTERNEMSAHLRSTEDRLNQEVDRARQEARGLSESMSQQATRSRAALQALEDRIRTALDDRAEAIAAAATERALADQLRNQVESLGALALSVERALQAGQKTRAGQPRKRATLPTQGDSTKRQDRLTKTRQR